MKLLGAKEFLKTVKPGTFCIEFWQSTKEQCYEIIDDFKKGLSALELYEKHHGEYYLFGDNSFSLAFIKPNEYEKEDDDEPIELEGNKYDCIFIYDKNIVGDASPTVTLQLVFESEDEWPNEVPIWGSDEKLSKEEISIIREWYLENDYFDITNTNSSAIKSLENEKYYKDDDIVNYK